MEALCLQHSVSWLKKQPAIRHFAITLDVSLDHLSAPWLEITVVNWTTLNKEASFINCTSLMQISTRSITWQQLDAFSHGQDDLLRSYTKHQDEEEMWIKRLGRGMAVGARWAGLSVWETADRPGFSCTTTSSIYSTEDGPPKKRKYSVSCSSLGENALLMPEAKVGNHRLGQIGDQEPGGWAPELLGEGLIWASCESG